MSKIFDLRFKLHQVHKWASLYPTESDERVKKVIAPEFVNGIISSKMNFSKSADGRHPAANPAVRVSNPKDFIEEVTCTALSTSSERLRIEVLTLLNGVSWPTASVLLHFGYVNLYPILDFRALWSLGVEASQVRYAFDFWMEYVLFCQKLAREAEVSMRELDRALWQYSFEKQRKD